MAVKFCPIASGSSGNCIYAGTSETNILIDAGLSGSRIQEGLKKLDLDAGSIDALFITHEHSDHIKGAGILSRRFNIPVYATEGTWRAMADVLGNISENNIKYIYPEEDCIIGDIKVRPYEIPHDAAEPVGYSIFAENRKLTVATDMGHITDTVRDSVCGSDILFLEANHDEDMLIKGPYPFYLKKRILGENGHISNITAAKLLEEVFSERLKYVYLGHLSAENNTPRLAYETVRNALEDCGALKYLRLEMARRYELSREIILQK